jgi:hypothetical protein
MTKIFILFKTCTCFEMNPPLWRRRYRFFLGGGLCLWHRSFSTSTVGRSVGRSVDRLNCCCLRQHSRSWLQSPQHPWQWFYVLPDIYVFRKGSSSSAKEGSVFPCRRYVCCTVVLAFVYTCCHDVQVTMNSVHSLSLHYIPNHICGEKLSVGQAYGVYL